MYDIIREVKKLRKTIIFMSIKLHNNSSQQNIRSPKKITNSENLSMIESKNPPNLVDLLVSRAIAPSHPSNKPVINKKMAK